MADTKHHHAPPPDHRRAYEVLDNLFISGHPDATQDFMTKGIRAVVDLEGDIDPAIPEQEDQKGKTLYVYWPIIDGPEMPDPDTVRSLASLVARLLEDEQKVLVHCRSGHNRSGMICARALIERGMQPREAVDKVRSGRGDGEALTNDTFVQWLLQEEISSS
jgi:protein-tyrosine phosphatase